MALTPFPWEAGRLKFQRQDGSQWAYDAASGNQRSRVVDVFVGPPGTGKSVLADTINLALSLNSEALGTDEGRKPFIAKVDVGRGSEGFIRLVQERLGPARVHEAVFHLLQLAPGNEWNVFDLQVGCEYPLPLERAFLENFVALATLPTARMDASEDMKDLISLAIDEAYRRCTAAGGSTKIYRPGVEPQVDAALNRYGFCVDEESPSWRAAVIRLCELGEHSLAERAQRHAVPIFEDLLKSARADRVQEALDRLGSNDNSYAILRTFEDAIAGFIMRFPTLNAPSRLDFGQARIVVLDLHHVAPMGSAAADQQSALMFLLARHVLARNFFLHPDCLSYVPEGVRAYHEKRFLEGLDTVKRLDFNDWHRAGRSTAVVAQAERDLREARKHNVQLAFTCQRLQDVRGWVASEASGLFILGTGDRGNIEDLTRRFDLTELSAELVRERLTGPRQEGAPFLAIFRGEGCRNEQFLVNTLGPTEMWGLSATLTDSALRDRLYERIGVAETLRRLVIAFPNGSARAEIERRMSARLSRGDAIDQILNGVLSELENEVTGSSGLGLSSQPHVEEAGLKPSHSDVV